VWPATRALWAPAFAACNARLAARLGVPPDALFAPAGEPP